MRVSCREDDRGYIHPSKQKGIKVFLDGAEIQDHCITADEEEGIALCYMLSDHGEYCIDPKDRSVAMTEELYGKVKIKLKRRSFMDWFLGV